VENLHSNLPEVITDYVVIYFWGGAEKEKNEVKEGRKWKYCRK
jgi:hypothetical protein